MSSPSFNIFEYSPASPTINDFESSQNWEERENVPNTLVCITGDIMETSDTFKEIWFMLENFKSVTCNRSTLEAQILRRFRNNRILYSLATVEKYALYDEFYRDFPTVALQFLDTNFIRNEREQTEVCIEMLKHIESWNKAVPPSRPSQFQSTSNRESLQALAQRERINEGEPLNRGTIDYRPSLSEVDYDESPSPTSIYGSYTTSRLEERNQIPTSSSNNEAYITIDA